MSDETVYEYLHKHDVKMSIVDFQTSIMLDRKTYSLAANGQNVTDTDVLVSDSSISTYSEDGEKIFDTSFGVKPTYNLFNYTEDDTERTSDTFNATTRTAEIEGYARNRELFRFHRDFARYLPLVLIHMYPQLYQRARETIANMTRADYLFLISYPKYSGYRIEHDPTFTVYFATSSLPSYPNVGPVLILIAGACLVALVVIAMRRRKPRQQLPKSSES